MKSFILILFLSLSAGAATCPNVAGSFDMQLKSGIERTTILQSDCTKLTISRTGKQDEIIQIDGTPKRLESGYTTVATIEGNLIHMTATSPDGAAYTDAGTHFFRSEGEVFLRNGNLVIRQVLFGKDGAHIGTEVVTGIRR